MTTEQNHQTDFVYERWLKELDDGTLFTYAEQSQASRAIFTRGTGWMKQPDYDTSKLMIVLGRVCEYRHALNDVALAILRAINPHSSRAEWSATLFRAAREALAKQYDDVERRSGPESYRQSECVRPYTRAERLIVLQSLFTVCDDFHGHGWCATRLAEEMNMILPGRS